MSGSYCLTNLRNKKGYHLNISKFNSDHSQLKEKYQMQFFRTKFRGTEEIPKSAQTTHCQPDACHPPYCRLCGPKLSFHTQPTPPHPPLAPAVVLPAGEPEGTVTRIAVGSQVVREPTGHLQNRGGQFSITGWARKLELTEPRWGQQESQGPHWLWKYQPSRSDANSTRKASKSFPWRGLQSPLR